MTRAEQPYESFSVEDDYEEYYRLSQDVLGHVAAAVICAENDPDRPDITEITWAELRSPMDGYMDKYELVERQVAENEIYQLYLHGLAKIYPIELGAARTEEELELSMAMISDLPKCEGRHIVSQYETGEGAYRVLKYTEVSFGEYGMSRVVEVWNEDADNRESFSLMVDVTEMPFGTVEPRAENGLSDAELEMLDKVHPMAYMDLWKVFHAQMLSDDLESILSGIRIMSEGETDADVLDAIISYARDKFEEAVSETMEAYLLRKYEMKTHDLVRMKAIITERLRQFETDA